MFERVLVAHEVGRDSVFSLRVFEVSDTRANDAAHGEEDTKGGDTHEKSGDVECVEVGDANTSSNELQILTNKLAVKTGDHTIGRMNDSVKAELESVDD